VAFTNAGDLWTPNTKLDEGCYVVTIRPSAADAGMPRVHVASSDGTLRQDSMPFFGVALATAVDRVVTLQVNQGDDIRDIGGTAIASIDAYKIADHPEICRSR
jgi:hypothetical protein